MLAANFVGAGLVPADLPFPGNRLAGSRYAAPTISLFSNHFKAGVTTKFRRFRAMSRAGQNTDFAIRFARL